MVKVDKQKRHSFTLVMLVFGFMLAIQFQTIKKPIVRDTRDMWELRDALLKEKQLQSVLLNEIRSNEEKLEKYETARKQSKEQALRETLDELKTEAGLTDVIGPGIVLQISPIYEGILEGKQKPTVSADLLARLVNELNMNGAKQISIDNQRLINTTVIRDINGETKVGGHALKKLPFEVAIIVDDMKSAEKLSKQMEVSKSLQDFYIDNLQIRISKPIEKLKIPAYQDPIRVRNMEPVKPDKGGSS